MMVFFHRIFSVVLFLEASYIEPDEEDVFDLGKYMI